MKKKFIVVAIILLIVFVGGIFLWQQNQNATKELNKNLPKGIRVGKSLFGNEYKIVNKIDGYWFKVPKTWDGLREIQYISERTEYGYIVSSMILAGNLLFNPTLTVDRFIEPQIVLGLESWVKNLFTAANFSGDFTRIRIKNFDAVKTQKEFRTLLGDFIYFFQDDSTVYAITSEREEYIKSVVEDSSW